MLLKKKNPPPELPTYTKVKIPNDCTKTNGDETSFIKYLFSSKSVLARLCCSLVPPIGPFKPVSRDFEGTALSMFLLTCIMFHRMGRGSYYSLMLPSYYVLVFTIFMCAISYMTGTEVTVRELICTCGYGLFGHTLTLLASQFADELFVPCLILFVGLSSLRICGILFLRTRVPGLVFITCTPAAIMHTTFPMYLHIISNQN